MKGPSAISNGGCVNESLFPRASNRLKLIHRHVQEKQVIFLNRS